MPRFVIFAGVLPGISTSADGLLVSGPGKQVFAQLVSQPLRNLVSIRLDVRAPGLWPLADWLNANRHNDEVNEVLAPARTLKALKPLLVGAWDFPAETTHTLGPTACFSILLGFLDEIFAAEQKGIVIVTGTLPEWNAAFESLAVDVFSLHADPPKPLDILNTIREFARAMKLSAVRP